MPLEDTLAELEWLKAQRNRTRELRDLEERKLLDQLYDTNRRMRGSPRAIADTRKNLQLSKDDTVREMQIQPELPRYNPSTDPKVKQLAENHGRNMENLQSKNRDLERQREEIRRRLEGLGRRPMKEDDSMNGLLQELKDQEARNQRMLEELRRILASQNIPMPQMAEPKTNRYVYPIYYGNSLVAEISAVRQAYISNGGNEPDILQQLAQMQAEAQAIDDSLRNRPIVKVKGKAQPDNSNLMTLELENERLQRQLLLLQEQNVTARQRRKDDREGRRLMPLTTYLHYYNQAGRRRAQTTYTDVGPLDVQVVPKIVVPEPEHYELQHTEITAIDPHKEKIDSDLQNKFGYDLGGSRISMHKLPEGAKSSTAVTPSPRDGSKEGAKAGKKGDGKEKGNPTPILEEEDTDSQPIAPYVSAPFDDRLDKSYDMIDTLAPGLYNHVALVPYPLGPPKYYRYPPPRLQPRDYQPVFMRVAAADIRRDKPVGQSLPQNSTHGEPTQFEKDYFSETARSDPGGNRWQRVKPRVDANNAFLSVYRPIHERHNAKTNNAGSSVGDQNQPQTKTSNPNRWQRARPRLAVDNTLLSVYQPIHERHMANKGTAESPWHGNVNGKGTRPQPQTRPNVLA